MRSSAFIVYLSLCCVIARKLKGGGRVLSGSSVEAALSTDASGSFGKYPSASLYAIIDMETLNIEDPHCVHGVQTSDGGYACTGM
jgi:hypothetical protein